MGVISSGVLAGLAKIGLVVVSIGGLTAGAYFAYQVGPGGGSDGTTVLAGATVSASPTAPLATLAPTVAPPTPSPSATFVPTQPRAPTQPPAPTADPACGKTTPNHLNIDKLGLQPNLTDAVITERDDDSIRIDFEGTEVIIFGWGEIVRIHADLSNEQQARILHAIDAVRYEC